jgi:hypothetical protein
MNKIMAALLLALGLACIAAPARADSEPYFITFSTVNSSAVNVISTATSSQHPLKFFALQVKGVGAAATSWDVRIEGSLDGSNFTPIVWHTASDGDGAVKGSTATFVTPYPIIRVKTNALSLGSATGITIKTLGSQ